MPGKTYKEYPAHQQFVVVVQRRIDLLHLAVNTNHQVEGQKKYPGCSLLFINGYISQFHPVSDSQVHILVNGQGRHMLKSIILVVFKRFKGIEKTRQRKPDPGFN
jgi:hypothetical protein